MVPSVKEGLSSGANRSPVSHMKVICCSALFTSEGTGRGDKSPKDPK